jgi:hypothetical protein
VTDRCAPLRPTQEALVAQFARELDSSAPADRCAQITRAHRTWARWWAGYAAVTFTSGVVLDTWAYCEPRTRRGRIGQAFLVGSLSWATLHLGWGVLGPTKGRVRP